MSSFPSYTTKIFQVQYCDKFDKISLLDFFHQYCCYANIKILRNDINSVIEWEDSSYYSMYKKEIYQIKFTKLRLSLTRKYSTSISDNDIIVITKNSSFLITLMEGCSKSKIQDIDLEPTILKILKEESTDKIVIPFKDAKISLNFTGKGIKSLKVLDLFKDSLKNEEVKAESEFSLINKKMRIISRFTPEISLKSKSLNSYLINLKEIMTNNIIFENKLIVTDLMKGISQGDNFSIFKHFQKIVFKICWSGFAKIASNLNKTDLNRLKSSLLDFPLPFKIEIVFSNKTGDKVDGKKVILDKSNKPRCEKIIDEVLTIKSFAEFKEYFNNLFSIYKN